MPVEPLCWRHLVSQKNLGVCWVYGMHEVLRLLNAIETTQAAGEQAAIATVVRVKGSAYRREGTKMLIDASGNQVCMISGGCLEQEVGEVAQRVIASGEPVVKFFDLDEDLVWGLGLGCGGSVDVYVEPFDKGEANARFLDAVRAQAAACLATVIAVSAGAGESLKPAARMFIAANGDTLGTLGNQQLDADLRALAQEKMSQLYPRAVTRSYTLADGSSADVFLDITMPPPELVLFGAGHDAIPLANDAHRLGFNVTVVDARHAFVTEERFPHARQLIRTHPSGFAEKVVLDARTYVVLMNHHLERDTESLAFVLSTEVPYVGVLGPSSRYKDMLDALEKEGRLPSKEKLERVRNPIGVDIGADTPEEISISIMAELVAVRGNYEAGFLSERQGPIHSDRHVLG